MIEAVARNTDPMTSWAAGQENAKFRKEAQKKQIHAALLNNPNSTYRELADYLNLPDQNIASRRLPDLEKVGKAERNGIKKCSITGRNMTCWIAL